MFLMVTMSTFMGESLLESYPRFVTFYVVIRTILAGMYLSAANRLDNSTSYARTMGVVGLLGVILSAASLLLNDPMRQIVFLSGILLEMGAVVLIGAKLDTVPIHRDHLVESIGLLSIILLGESVISLMAGFTSKKPG